MFLKFKLELAKFIRIAVSNAANGRRQKRRQIDAHKKDIVMWGEWTKFADFISERYHRPFVDETQLRDVYSMTREFRRTTIRTCLPYKDRNPPRPNRRRDRSRRPWARLRNEDFSDPRWLLPRGSWLASSRKCSCKQDDELKDSSKSTTYNGQKNFTFQWGP